MQKVYTNENIALVGNIKSFLEHQGYACILKNEFSSSVMGEVAFFEVWPELWILDDTKYHEVIALLEDKYESPTTHNIDWHCPKCAEQNTGSFEICWQCQTQNPALDNNADG